MSNCFSSEFSGFGNANQVSSPKLEVVFTTMYGAIIKMQARLDQSMSVAKISEIKFYLLGGGVCTSPVLFI